MRARLLRPAAGLALASAAVLALSAGAATKPLALKDAAGDANALNGQGILDDAGRPGPGSQPGKDILSLTMATIPGKTCTGYTAVVELAAPPTSNTIYRVLGTTAKNDRLFWLQYDSNQVRGTTTTLRSGEGTNALATPAKVDGSKIIITVTEKDLKTAGENLKGLTVIAPGVDVRSSTGVLTVPSWDVLTNDAVNFKACG